MNKRGAEMVEYAIVLACIAAVGVFFYTNGEYEAWDTTTGLPKTFKSILQYLWSRIYFTLFPIG